MERNLLLAAPTPLGKIVLSILTEEPTQRLIGFTDIIHIEQTSELQQCFEQKEIWFFVASPSLVMARNDYNIVHSLRRQSKYTHLPIVLMQNHPGIPVLIKAYAAGVTHVINFPARLGKIRKELISALTQNELKLYL